MKTAQLRQQSYSKLLIIRLLVGLIRFLFDIPSFFRFLATGQTEPRPRSRP
jgi:hypothetical protein